MSYRMPKKKSKSKIIKYIVENNYLALRQPFQIPFDILNYVEKQYTMPCQLRMVLFIFSIAMIIPFFTLQIISWLVILVWGIITLPYVSYVWFKHN